MNVCGVCVRDPLISPVDHEVLGAVVYFPPLPDAGRVYDAVPARAPGDHRVDAVPGSPGHVTHDAALAAKESSSTTSKQVRE